IITRGFIENAKIENMVETLEEKYEILAIIGTIDPKIDTYPFFSISEIYTPKGIGSLRKILKRQTIFDKVNLEDVINRENIWVNPNFYYKEQILDQEIQRMINQGYVKPEFLLSVYKREGVMTTYLKGGI